MLDADTKRRIDSCRDILVGKVPDPKSQVEQITIALIYKFMDDMDAEAEELGGKRSFFAGEYARFGWAQLMSPSLSGFEVLNVYSEAIQKMNENPGVPPLFRDIFKNAYLPYRDELGILKTSCVTSGKFDPAEHKAVLPAEISMVKCSVRKNSIIVSRMNTEALVGANAYIHKDYDSLFLPDRLWQTVITKPDVNVCFVSFILASEQARGAISSKCGGTSGSMKNIAKPQFLSVQIPLPPLEVQHQIVAEIEGYQKIIDGARQVLDNYKPHVVVDPDWPVVPLGTLVSTSSGGTPSKGEPEFWNGVIPWVSPKDMKVDFIEETEDHISELATKQSATKLVGKDTLLCVVRSGILQHTFPVALTVRPMCFNQDIVAIQPTSTEIEIRYLFYIFKSNSAEILKNGIKPGVTVQSFHSGYFKAYPLPLPDLETQRAIVAEIEAEEALVNANRELIRRMEAKVKAAIDRVWGA